MHHDCMQERMTRRASLPYPASVTSTSVWHDRVHSKDRRNAASEGVKPDEKHRRGRGASVSTVKQATPSYIPSYIQPLSETVCAKKPATATVRDIVNSTSPRGCTRRYKSASLCSATDNGVSGENRPLTSSSGKRPYVRRRSSIKVRDAVAAMEERITSTVHLRPPNKTQVTANDEKSSRKTALSRNTKHRRSMSDPHMHKTFSEVKKLWDNKVGTAVNSRGLESRSSSTTSVSSTENSKSFSDLKTKNPGRTQPRKAPKKVQPRVPPKPKVNVKKSRKAAATVNSVEKPAAVQDGKQMTNSSVSAKAMLFGGTAKPAFATSRQPGAKSPAFQRHRRSWSDESLEKSSLLVQASTDTTHIYDEVPVVPTSELTEDEKLIDNLKSKADHAREKRMNKRGSCDSSATSDEDEMRRRGSFLNNSRRQSSDSSIKKQPSFTQQSPLASEAVLFGVESPTDETADDQFLASGSSATAKDKRRTSSLHKLIEYKRVASYNTASAPSTPQRTPAESISSLEADASDDARRPTTLKLLQRERSQTEGEFGLQKPSESRDSGRCNTLDNARTKSPVAAKPAPPPVRAKPSRQEHADGLEATHTAVEAASVTSTDSLGTFSTSTSLSGEFNLIEEYDKIAQEVNENDPSATASPPTKDQQQSVGARDSLEVPSRASSLRRGPNADSWSDFDNSDDGDDDSIAGTPRKNRSDSSITLSPSASIKESKEVKLHNIAKELLSTEESYVAVLHLIDQVFHKRIMEAATQKHIIPEAVVNNIFCHIPAIYQFHSSFLLPQLRERLDKWESNPRIGDIMTKAAPFLKMYSLYVQHFDEAMNTIKSNQEKNSAFDAIIKSIQKLPECSFLTLQHHMLGPVQRVPRYRMLLADYVKRLPEDADERPVAEKALQLITVAATHSNETMKKIEKFHKLVNVFNQLADVNFDIVDVSRELLKEGKIIKISARNGEKYERYLYLFSDMLLCCTPLGRLQGKSYRVTAKIDVEGMQIADAKNPTAQNTFCVHGLQKSMEFATTSQEEKETWVAAIKGAVADYIDRKKTFEKQATLKTPLEGPATDVTFSNGQPEGSPIHPVPMNAQQLIDIADADLGTRAPRWIKDNEVTMCMCCSKSFNKLLRRRHHCRACGRVVCSECSEHKAVLQYERDKAQKVCSRCFNVLTGQQHQSVTSDGEKKGVLEVEADTFAENSVIADYLFFTEHVKKKAWAKTWCVIPKDELCLYFYGAHQDVRAQMTMPLPGYEVTVIPSNEHKHSFKLAQARKILYFATNDKAVLDRWMYALKKAGTGEDITREEVYSLGKIKASEANEEPADDFSSDASSCSGEDYSE